MGKAVLLLRQLDLNASLCGKRPLCEYIKNKGGAVDNTHICDRFDIFGLICGKLAVEYEQVCFQRLYLRHQLFKPARADICGSVGRRPFLEHASHNLRTCGMSKLFQLAQRKLCVKFTRIYSNDYRLYRLLVIGWCKFCHKLCSFHVVLLYKIKEFTLAEGSGVIISLKIVYPVGNKLIRHLFGLNALSRNADAKLAYHADKALQDNARLFVASVKTWLNKALIQLDNVKAAVGYL